MLFDMIINIKRKEFYKNWRKDMSNLMHLFKVNQKVKCNVDGKFFNGTVKETYEDHIIIDVPEISDHMWYEEGLNIGDVYPDYNYNF